MRRWISRIARVVVVTGLILSVVGWWAMRQTRHVPEFYTEVTRPRSAERTATLREQMRGEIHQLAQDTARRGAWNASFSQREINAWLAEELPAKFPRLLARGASDPRIAIRDGKLLAAVRYQHRGWDTIVSCELQVTLTEQPNMLALEVTNLRAGLLPIPLHRFVRGISKEAAAGDLDIRWDRDQDEMVALVTIPAEHPKYVVTPVTIESVRLGDGELTLSGHAGELAEETYRPRGEVYRFVSFDPERSVNRYLSSRRLPRSTVR